jgi:hypothetical protein
MSLRKENNVLVLLGAGASFEAGIPTSPMMIKKLESLLDQGGKWEDFRELYHFVKSAIYFGDGISGKFEPHVNYNIERLVNILSEINRKVEHPLYPFIATWNTKLIELGGMGFENVRDFKQHILQELQNDWVLLDNYSKSDYYGGLFDFRKDFQHPLRVFSLNYDLCVERNRESATIERGFGESRTWHWRNFDYPEQEQPDIFLYKLHGSIDWLRDDNENLTYTDEPAKIKPDRLGIIFGTDYKLQYIDPFLFFAYQFRQWTLEAKLIIAIGYGFGDEHINAILGQALKSSSNPDERRLLAVAPFEKENDETSAMSHVSEILRVPRRQQIVVRRIGAGEFMSHEMTIDGVAKCFPDGEDVFQEIK